MTNGTDPANPCKIDVPCITNGKPDLIKDVPFMGLTKREYFAAMVMQALLANLYETVFGNRLLAKLEQRPEENIGQVVARNAMSFTDALIAELNKEAKS